MSRAASLITPRAAERAATYYEAHPDAYAYALGYVLRVVGKRRDRDPEEVAAVAAAIVPAFVREGREDDHAAIRSAVRRAVERAAAAVAQDYDATPYLIDEDWSRTRLEKNAPDPGAAHNVHAIDYAAQALLRLEDDARRESIRRAAVEMRHGAPALTSRAMPSTERRHISEAIAALRTVESEVLADPYNDGTRRTPNDWSAGDRTRFGCELAPTARPSAATLEALRAAALEAAQRRDDMRVQVALAHMEGVTGDDLDAVLAEHQDAAWKARRAAAGLAHAETHARRQETRTDVEPQALTYDPAALSPYERPRHPVEKKDRPAQVPDWQTPGGTARPHIGACVAVRLIDTGTPGTEVLRLEITTPEGERWVRTYVPEDAWSDEDTRNASHALGKPGTAAADALSHVERILSRPVHGAPKRPDPRKRARTGSTGPTVPAYGMTR